MTIAAYVLILAVGVWILVRRADTMYGALYGRLTDVEVKAIRIERDLSDPARLLHDLANDGIDLDAIFDDLHSGRGLEGHGRPGAPTQEIQVLHQPSSQGRRMGQDERGH